MEFMWDFQTAFSLGCIYVLFFSSFWNKSCVLKNLYSFDQDLVQGCGFQNRFYLGLISRNIEYYVLKTNNVFLKALHNYNISAII